MPNKNAYENFLEKNHELYSKMIEMTLDAKAGRGHFKPFENALKLLNACAAELGSLEAKQITELYEFTSRVLGLYREYLEYKSKFPRKANASSVIDKDTMRDEKILQLQRLFSIEEEKPLAKANKMNFFSFEPTFMADKENVLEPKQVGNRGRHHPSGLFAPKVSPELVKGSEDSDEYLEIDPNGYNV